MLQLYEPAKPVLLLETLLFLKKSVPMSKALKSTNAFPDVTFLYMHPKFNSNRSDINILLGEDDFTLVTPYIATPILLGMT